MRKGNGYPVVVPVLVALLVSATALLGRGFGTGAAVPLCADFQEVLRRLLPTQKFVIQYHTAPLPSTRQTQFITLPRPPVFWENSCVRRESCAPWARATGGSGGMS